MPTPARRPTSTRDLDTGPAEPTAGGTGAWEAAAPLVWCRDLRVALPEPFRRLATDPSTGRLAAGMAAWRFLDTETTGLSGGSGTWVFLVGWSRLVEDAGGIGLMVSQYFLEDLGGEPGLVEAVESGLAAQDGAAGTEEGPACRLATYNGASFDLPLLRTRWIMNGRAFPELPHLDCVHPARRLWRQVAGQARLGTIEALVLGVRRPDDIPGSLVPQLYLDYLRRGAGPGFAAELGGVFRHHVQDVVSLAGLWMVLEAISRPGAEAFWLPWMPGDPLPDGFGGEAGPVERPDGGPAENLASGILAPEWPRNLPTHARGLLRQLPAEAGPAMLRAGWESHRTPAWGGLLAGLCKTRGMRGEALEIWLELWREHADAAALIEALKHLEHRAGPEGRRRALELVRRARLNPLAARPALAAELERREARLVRLLRGPV
jgi:uncharacterized protein YprB with RNaseH-like and TPR domain